MIHQCHIVGKFHSNLNILMSHRHLYYRRNVVAPPFYGVHTFVIFRCCSRRNAFFPLPHSVPPCNLLLGLTGAIVSCTDSFSRYLAQRNMYIDETIASNSSMKSSSEDHDVKEATAALKGLLGLGGTTSSQSTPFPSTLGEQTNESAAVPSIDAPKQPKKKKNKKKKPAATSPTIVPTTEAGNTPPNGSTAAVVSNHKPKGKTNHPSKKNKKKESENYSLSAFQSSPDASKLPTPSFLSSPPTAKHNATAATPSTNENHAAMWEIGESNLPLGNETTKSASPPAESKETNRTLETEEKEPVSATGVNLAAAIAAEQRSEPMYPAHNNGPMYPPPAHHPHHPYPMPHMPPQHAMYGTPPGYVTIPVQVPPHLMPGRHMVVTSPAGYPVQVAVPEGIAPGMIIPVHVPVGPPLHMMPFPPHYPPPPSSQYPPHCG